MVLASLDQMTDSVFQKVTKTATASDDSTAYTPPEIDEKVEQQTSSVPQPDKTFILRDKKSGQLLTLLDGVVRLNPAGTLGSAYHWTCHERHGWLGFKNIAAGTFLSHDRGGVLQAMVPHHEGWEFFCVRMMPDGGYVLLMTHCGKLWPVQMKQEDGLQKLCKADAPVKDGLVWEFVEV
ncbi:uncharacterized protein N0V89_005364 [Didymosphaeria variabile]|uniref:Ricin B lectin domain-containing protein n=1 Tax=Didymosphaeria variabile TaxID=1932322 RepID=A0A9W9CBE5_9PLEO|nr:uncharacterized protein N0V89_005364 [Didymosphaeria variabile]KAJ4353634.1 hypothetical protein N0V89_005364 [Didymosphaeria variabile]